jgi:hypothetical protein
MTFQRPIEAERVAVVLLSGALTVCLALSALAAQKQPKPATHSTKGMIASVNGDTMVINQTVRGKAQQLTVTLNSQTQRSGDLTAGHLVTVQYRQENQQKVATAVRESGAKAATKPARVSTKPIINNKS